GVELSEGVLYRARIAIPARVPVGDYTAETFLIQDGRVVAAAVREIRIDKSGFERFVAFAAQRWSLAYGLVAVGISLLLGGLAGDADPSIAMGGQVGSQVKMRVGEQWLVANVRSLRLDPADPDHILGYVDFLGEGFEDPATGGLTDFRRGVTRYPIPGVRVF